MSFLDLFGGKKGDKLLDAGVKAGDALFFMPEEKAAHNKELYKLWIEYQKATAPQNEARRLIALIVCGVWAFFCVVFMYAWALQVDVTRIEKLISFGTLVIMPPTIAIISWYFWKRKNDENPKS